MGSSRTKRLESTVAAIQQRWGLKALRRLESSTSRPEVPHIPTGFPSLDKILDIGGFPRGRITEILGTPTSGMSTLALKVIASAQGKGDTAAYVDLGRTFDPDYAVRCGVHLDKMLLVRPDNGREALEIAHALIAGGGAGVLAFDSVPYLLVEPRGARAMASALRRLVADLSRSACVPMFLTPLHFGPVTSQDNYPDGFVLSHYAALRLLVEKEEWILKRRDVMGYRARASVLKNDFGPRGKGASISITFNGVVHGNGT